MVNRWSVVLLLVGVIAGYVISGTSVKAKTDPLPLAVGETVILRYSTDAHTGRRYALTGLNAL